MTPKQRRIAICAHLGWNYDSLEEEVFFSSGGDILGLKWPSLDAMHEAEKTADQHEYRIALAAVCARANHHPYQATASQREEAFLRTIGKWRTRE